MERMKLGVDWKMQIFLVQGTRSNLQFLSNLVCMEFKDFASFCNDVCCCLFSFSLLSVRSREGL